MTTHPSILTTLKETFSFTFTLKHFKELVKISLLPIAILIGIEFFNIYENIALDPKWMALLMVGIGSLIQAFWVPKWIQYCHAPATNVKYFAVCKDNYEFFGYRFLIGAFVLLWAILFSPVMQVLEFTATLVDHNPFVKYSLKTIVILLGVALMIVLYARYSFKFVAISLSKKMSLNSAWKHTAPFALQLYLIQILSETKLGYSLGYFGFFESFLAGYGIFWLQLFTLAFSGIVSALYFCAVTKLYKHSSHK